MNAAAVICECNPFHKGHQYIFAKAKNEAECVIAVMSGNFVQRAEAACFDKYARAKAIISSGADLVIELPFPWSSASAEYFASAGVSLADAMGADILVFGAANSNSSLHQKIAEYLCSDEYARRFAEKSAEDSRSLGSAQLRERCLRERFGETVVDIMRSPNDILAIEYCKENFRMGQRLCLKAAERISETTDPAFRGATALREMLNQESPNAIAPYIPANACEIFKAEYASGRYVRQERWERILFEALRMMGDCSRDTAEGRDGVMARLMQCAEKAVSAKEMFSLAATKKYTNARFRRAALYNVLSVTESALNETPCFTQLLAASKNGCRYLSENRKNISVDLLTKPSAVEKLDECARRQYEMLCNADRLYTLCTEETQPAGAYLKRTPYIDK